MSKEIRKLFIHKHESVYGRDWLIFENGKELHSFNRCPGYTYSEIVEKMKDEYGDIEIELGKPLFNQPI